MTAHAAESPSLHWAQRDKKNCYVFILCYALLGAVTGITNNSFMSYLDLVTPNLVKGINIYTAIATLVMSALLLYVHRLGYKKVSIYSATIAIVGLLITLFVHHTGIVAFAFIFIQIGVGVFDYLYPMVLTSYSPDEIRVSMFSKMMYINLITQSVVTFFGGKLVVYVFSILEHCSYSTASTLSANPSAMSGAMLQHYIDAYHYPIYLAIGFSVLALLCALMLKEQKSDYAETAAEREKRQATKLSNMKLLFRKDIILWIIYLGLIQAGALLIIPYLPIYLNDFLHIDRGTVSTILTLQTLAMVIGFMLSPWLEKKMGSILSNGILTLLCVPLMFIMATGTRFGAHTALVIGIVLFLRSGLANATNPIQQSLQMTFVPKDLRPALTAMTTVISSVVGILVGLFTRYILLTHAAGYGQAYYLTAAFYTIASLLLMICFTKKYNRRFEQDDDNDDQ